MFAVLFFIASIGCLVFASLISIEHGVTTYPPGDGVAAVCLYILAAFFGVLTYLMAKGLS